MAPNKEGTLMKKYFIYSLRYQSYLILCVLALTAVSTKGYANGLCSGANATLECLSDNFETLYSKNYSLFWDILHMSAKKAQQCKSISDVFRFLELVRLQTNNAEFNEFFNETIENMCVKNSKCFFDGSIRLNTQDQIQMVKRLKSSVFVDQTEITNIFKRNKNNEKYKKFVELYFE
jgi:hypothetical protein